MTGMAEEAAGKAVGIAENVAMNVAKKVGEKIKQMDGKSSVLGAIKSLDENKAQGQGR